MAFGVQLLKFEDLRGDRVFLSQMILTYFVEDHLDRPSVTRLESAEKA